MYTYLDENDHPYATKRILYITSLLNETLPLSLLTPKIYQELNIDQMSQYGIIHILLNNELKTSIESKNLTSVANWKSQLQQTILKPFEHTNLNVLAFLNLAPYTRTIVYSLLEPQSYDSLKDTLKHWFYQVDTTLSEEENGHLLAFSSSLTAQFEHIGHLYKLTRKLQSYQYIIGMGQLAFCSDYNFKDSYSITEYKYLQRYSDCIEQKNYSSIIILIKELEVFLVEHHVKDSKLIYIYKELMSITIRYLYENEIDNLTTIERLNQAINNFTLSFNDLSDITHFILTIVDDLNALISNRPKYHPQISKVLHIIHSCYMQDLALSTVAHELKLSTGYLSRLFKEELQINFKDYLTKYRIKKAKDLLVNTSKSINDIARLTGYNTPNQLTRIFRKYEQITPSDYRHKL